MQFLPHQLQLAQVMQASRHGRQTEPNGPTVAAYSPLAILPPVHPPLTVDCAKYLV